MKKKDNFGLITVLSTCCLVGGLVLAANMSRVSFINKATDNSHSVTLSDSINRLTTSSSFTSGSASITTPLLNDILFSFENMKAENGYWAVLSDGEFHNVNAINDVSKVVIGIEGEGTLEMLTGTLASNSRASAIMYNKTTNISSGSSILTIDDTVTHLKFIATGEVKIIYIEFEYGCTSAIETNAETINFKGDGSLNHPYLIDSDNAYIKACLLTIGNTDADADVFAGKHIKFTSDIGTIDPISNGEYRFCYNSTLYNTAIIDGGGHTININLTFGGSNRSLFGKIGATGSVSNLKVTGSYSSTYLDGTKGAFNAVISDSLYGTISNIETDVTFTAASHTVGGLVGYAYGGSVISNCINKGSISSTYTGGEAYAGGIAGETEGTIINCDNEGAINVSNHGVGGIAGFLHAGGTIESSDNLGDVTSLSAPTSVQAGNPGIAGITGVTSSNCLVKNCKNEGDVTATSSNFASNVAGIVGKFADSSTITGCINEGDINGGGDVGGLAGRTVNGVLIEKSKNLGNINGFTYVGGLVGKAEKNTTIDQCDNGESTNINGITVTARENTCAGIVGYITNGITITTCNNYAKIINTLTSTGTGKRGVGGIGGFVEEYFTCTNCKNYGEIRAEKYYMVGGLFGKICESTAGHYNNITGCENYADVYGDKFVGGLLGRCNYSNFTDCVNQGDIYCKNDDLAISPMYGEVINVSYSTFTNCTNTGTRILFS